MRALFALAVLAMTTGCGPIFSTYLIVDAESQLSAAKAAEADRYAIYEYTAAEAYLKKAHEELGYADYGPAIDYAYKASDLAKQGTERAKNERHKHIDQPAATVVEEEAPTKKPEPPAKSFIIKKIDTSSVPATDPSNKSPK